jgi:hypothetical protein
VEFKKRFEKQFQKSCRSRTAPGRCSILSYQNFLLH